MRRTIPEFRQPRPAPGRNSVVVVVNFALLRELAQKKQIGILVALLKHADVHGVWSQETARNVINKTRGHWWLKFLEPFRQQGQTLCQELVAPGSATTVEEVHGLADEYGISTAQGPKPRRSARPRARQPRQAATPGSPARQPRQATPHNLTP